MAASITDQARLLEVTSVDYAFGDFVRVGLSFSVIVLFVSVLLVPLLLPLQSLIQ